MTALGEDFNRYGFVVAKDANKLQIKQAVEELYDVKVAGCEHHALCRETQTASYKEWRISWTNRILQEGSGYPGRR